MNKASIDKSNRKKKRKSHRIHSSGVEIFRRLLRNGIHKSDINGIKAKVLIQRFQRLDRPKRPPAGPPTLEGSPSCLLCVPPSGEILKLEGRDYNDSPDRQSLGAAAKAANQVPPR